MPLRNRGILAGAAVAGLLALSAAPAVAKPCATHGGGNSEVGQYEEQVPGACGNQDVGNGSSGGAGGSSSDSGSGSGLPPASIQQLEALGPAGVATAKYAQATAPADSGKGGSGGSNEGGSSGSDDSAGSSASAGDGSPLGAISDVTDGDSDDGGMGTVLPILIGTGLLGGIGFLALRRIRLQ